MERALLHQLRTATDRALRDAQLLEDSMAGVGTKDRLLLNRCVRAHWDKAHLQRVKVAYRGKFHRDLATAIKSETSGDYEKALLGVIGER
jgi:annexin A7/11